MLRDGPYIKREGFIFLEFDEENWVLVVHGHKLALRIPWEGNRIQRKKLNDLNHNVQSPAIETGNEIRQTFTLDTDFGG